MFSIRFKQAKNWNAKDHICIVRNGDHPLRSMFCINTEVPRCCITLAGWRPLCLAVVEITMDRWRLKSLGTLAPSMLHLTPFSNMRLEVLSKGNCDFFAMQFRKQFLGCSWLNSNIFCYKKYCASGRAKSTNPKCCSLILFLDYLLIFIAAVCCLPFWYH